MLYALQGSNSYLISVFVIYYSIHMEESDSSFQNGIFEFVKKNLIILTLLSAGLIFLSIGVIQMFSAKTTTVKFEKGEDVAGAEASTQETKIMVDVDGQVLKPGLYSLKSNARVQDALIAAGGLSSNADRNAINLAAKISDGQKIYIPEIGEKPSAVTVANSTSVTSLNRATGLL